KNRVNDHLSTGSNLTKVVDGIETNLATSFFMQSPQKVKARSVSSTPRTATTKTTTTCKSARSST
ncbi:MAG: hypothetical protein ACK521_11885, partial [bacterium]